MGISITNHMIQTSYEYAKKLYHKEIQQSQALNKIVEMSGMVRGSALAYINNFGKMMIGEEYHRTMNEDATDFFLSNIYKDYGEDKLRLALWSVKLHVKYYSKQRNVNLVGIISIAEGFENSLK